MTYDSHGRSNDGVQVSDDAFAKAGTEKALLIEWEGEEHWIPYSVIHDGSEVYVKDDRGALVVKRWFAQKKGWEP